MNAGTLNGLVTLVLLIAFIGGVIWLYSDRNRSALDAASRLPLEDDDAGDTHSDIRKNTP